MICTRDVRCSALGRLSSTSFAMRSSADVASSTRRCVPDAFAPAMTDAIAINLFAA
jgi:hypothetical protein